MDLIISNHAKRKSEKEFVGLDIPKTFETVVNCSKEEVTSLKNTPSYKRMKASDKKKVFYKKTPSEDLYFVCSTKTSKSGQRKDMIVTMIDLKKEDPSFISSDFLIEARRREFELIEASKKQSKKSNKKKGKKRPNYEEVKPNTYLLQGQHNLLDKIKQVNDLNLFDYKFKFQDFDVKFHLKSMKMLKMINLLAERKKALVKALNSYEMLKENDSDENKKALRKSKEQLRSMITSILSSVSEIKDDKHYINLESFTSKKASSGSRKAVYNLFADILFSMSKSVDILESDEISNKSYINLEKALDAFGYYRNRNERLTSALSLFSSKIVSYDRKKMLDFISIIEKETEVIYLRPIQSDLEKLKFKLMLIRDEKTKKDVNKMIDFYNIFIEKMNNENSINLSLYHI